jgi:ribonuclease J
VSDEDEGLELVSRSSEGGVSVVPLGGLGEIGMNCMVYEYDGQAMVVDCGLYFPDSGDYGVDYIVPSFAYLTANREALKGIVITHGHEDHIGAVPFLLREVNPPIYGPPLALAMIAEKLKEHGLYQHADLREVSAGETCEVGPFTVEFIHVNHSIPQTCSLAIRTPVGLLVHTGDFKVDHRPIDEPPIDLARFAALGDEGVLCLLSDSTNIYSEGYTQSEGWVADQLDRLVERASGRVIVALFASNLHRVQSLLDIAHAHNRRVVLLGRSLSQNVALGRRLGLVHLPSETLLIAPDEVEAFRHDELMILSTGSQGEPRSAMTRMAHNDHHQLKIVPGDWVVFSSRVIPGNERPVGRVIDQLHRYGATVFEWATHPVHASGHAAREELKLILNLTRPDMFVPIHGEYRHLVKHAELAEELGVEDAFIIENGDVLTLWEDSAEVTDRISAGRALVDGKHVEDAPSVALQDRRRLARTGIVVAWLVLDASTGEVVGGPRLMSQGVLGAEAPAGLEKEAARVALEAVQALSAESRRDVGEVAETMRRAVRRLFNQKLERKPVVIPIVHEL